MNDFTKEELELLLSWSEDLSFENGTEGTSEEQALDKKIKSMIDNYSNEKTYQVKLNLDLSYKEINYLVDECIMPFLYPEKRK